MYEISTKSEDKIIMKKKYRHEYIHECTIIIDKTLAATMGNNNNRKRNRKINGNNETTIKVISLEMNS